MKHAAVPGLSGPEKFGLWVLLAVVIAFGVVTELRSDFMHNKHTDLGVYLRGAYSVQSGRDLYSTTDRGWHYNYPPLFAILLVPLAEAPPGARGGWTVPFALSVAVWYVVSVVMLWLTVHWLAKALEAASDDPEAQLATPSTRRWWALRVVPIIIAMPAIGSTLSRGQVNLFLLWLLVIAAIAMVYGRRFSAGIALGVAICIKVMPLFLLCFSVRRRDWRMLSGALVAVVACQLLIPAAVFGPQRAWRYNVELFHVLYHPAAAKKGRADRNGELVGTADNQSILAIFHNTFDPPSKEGMPEHISPGVKIGYLALGGAMTLLTLLLASGAGGFTPVYRLRDLLVYSLLLLVMVLVSPVCHMHYFVMAIPLIMVLCHVVWQRHNPRLDAVLVIFALLYLIANILPKLPPFMAMRPEGVVMYSHLALWAAGFWVLWKRPAWQADRLLTKSGDVAEAVSSAPSQGAM